MAQSGDFDDQQIKHLEMIRAVVARLGSNGQTCERLKGDADEVICAITPDLFFAVGTWYEHLEQTPDDEVIELLRASP